MPRARHSRGMVFPIECDRNLGSVKVFRRGRRSDIGQGTCRVINFCVFFDGGPFWIIVIAPLDGGYTS